MIGMLHGCQPHEVNIRAAGLFHFPGGVDVADVGIYHELKQHAGVVAGSAAALVLLKEWINVEPIDDLVDGAHRMVGDDQLINIWRQQHALSLSISLEYRLLHTVTD